MITNEKKVKLLITDFSSDSELEFSAIDFFLRSERDGRPLGLASFITDLKMQKLANGWHMFFLQNTSRNTSAAGLREDWRLPCLPFFFGESSSSSGWYSSSSSSSSSSSPLSSADSPSLPSSSSPPAGFKHHELFVN